MVVASTGIVMRTLRVDDITLDPDCQPRTRIDPGIVEEYSDAYLSSADMPPVVVFHDGSTHWLADGWHRIRACMSAGLGEVDAILRRGTKRDAILFAAGANATHGVRRTNEDKRRSVFIILRDREWSLRSDRWIAEVACVSDRFVNKLRSAVESTDKFVPTANGSQLGDKRIGRDGKERGRPIGFTLASIPTTREDPAACDLQDEPGLDDPDEGGDDPSFETLPTIPPDLPPRWGEDSPDPTPVRVSDVLDAWIETLPLRRLLDERSRALYESDACLFRDFREILEDVADRAKALLKKYDKRGAYHAAVRNFFATRKPQNWVVCPPEEVGGCGGTGLSGNGRTCPACRGRGYRLNAVATQKQIAWLKRLGFHDGACLDPGTASEVIDDCRREDANREGS